MNTTTQVTTTDTQNIIAKVVIGGDLSGLTSDQKVKYYTEFCQSLGLNPLTQPFQLITFQGKQRLYATKDCTEQLRKIHGVSIISSETKQVGELYIVTVKAQDKTGKTDMGTGAVTIKGLVGDQLANAVMKAETKAKRRVTLSICGLGILDESETDTIGEYKIQPITPATVLSKSDEKLMTASSMPNGTEIDIDRTPEGDPTIEELEWMESQATK